MCNLMCVHGLWFNACKYDFLYVFVQGWIVNNFIREVLLYSTSDENL